jgi:hypothetical protein
MPKQPWNVTAFSKAVGWQFADCYAAIRGIQGASIPCLSNIVRVKPFITNVNKFSSVPIHSNTIKSAH